MAELIFMLFGGLDDGWISRGIKRRTGTTSEPL
jgi:hypothetical protein